MPRATFSIEDALGRGGQIVECREHLNNRGKYTVRVELPPGGAEPASVLTYTNISGHLLAMFRRSMSVSSKAMVPPTNGTSAKSPGRPEIAPAQRGVKKKRTEATGRQRRKSTSSPPPPPSEHESSSVLDSEEQTEPPSPSDIERYSTPYIVYLRMPEDGQIEVFGNVSLARIEAIHKQVLAMQYDSDDDDGDDREPEDVLDACVKRGGTIIHVDPFPLAVKTELAVEDDVMSEDADATEGGAEMPDMSALLALNQLLSSNFPSLVST
ncbi:hypothetical protein DFJ74DRAFT_460535 [Hyaloraphidium curvatum]|nr:hypothetical protein DFJ74DRAFT_460535 [Hyaloraphidium curvatum]